MTNHFASSDTRPAAHAPAVRGNGILLVEDEAVVAMDLTDQLEEMGYRVCAVADNGADARALAEHHRPDAILMDVILKGPIDGIEVAAGIAQAGLAPVIFLTAFSDLDTVRRAARTAPFGYLAKPFQRGEVRAAIEVAMHKFAVERELRARARWCTPEARPAGASDAADDGAAPLARAAGAAGEAPAAPRPANERPASVEHLRQSEERFRAAFTFAPVGMALMSLDLEFLHANPAMCNLLGRSPEEMVQLHRDRITHALDCASEDQQLAQLVAGTAPVVEFEKRFLDIHGQSVWALVSAALLKREGVAVCFVYQVHDMRRRKEVERRLSTLARTDSLTGLANRRYWREEADRRVAEAHIAGRNVGVLFLDLDNFKAVNDSLGHVAGDQLLKLVAQRLRRVVRSSDVIARYGGDEFLILLTDLASRGDVAIVARKLIEVVRKKFVLDAGAAVIGVSVGAAVFPYDGGDTRSLLQAADSALYVAKSRGRNRVQFSVPPESSAVPQETPAPTS